MTSKQDQITTLKIASNPFAKGFRESGKARVTYETLAAQYSGFVQQKSYSPELATPAPLMPGFFQRGMPGVGSCNTADERAYSEALIRDKSRKLSQMEDDKTLQLFHRPRTLSSAYHCYPLYYPHFSPSSPFTSQERKWSSFENLRNADSYVNNTLFIRNLIASDKRLEDHRSLIPSPLNLAVTPCGKNEKLERTSTAHFDEKVLQSCHQYQYHPNEFPSVQKSKEGIAQLYPYGQLYSDSNIPLRFTSYQEELLEARADRSNNTNLLSLNITRSQSANLSRSSSLESLIGPTRCNTEPSTRARVPIMNYLGYESTPSVR